MSPGVLSVSLAVSSNHHVKDCYCNAHQATLVGSKELCNCVPNPEHTGDGIVVVVDGARFLPACTTISRVVASVWSSSGMLLVGPWEGPAQPSSDARSPAFMCKASLDVAQANTSFDDPTATLLLQVRKQHVRWVIAMGNFSASSGGPADLRVYGSSLCHCMGCQQYSVYLHTKSMLPSTCHERTEGSTDGSMHFPL